MQFVSYAPDLADAVRAFNARLAADPRTAPYQFGVPSGGAAPEAEPSAAGAAGSVGPSQSFFAVDEGGAVRGGVVFHPQRYWVGGREQAVVNIQLPVSEGLIDRQYAYLGPWLLKQTVRRHPLTFAVGMGGLGNALPKLLGALGWQVQLVPFLFRVLRPAAFVREVPRLGPAGVRQTAAHVLGVTGLSWALARGLDAAAAVRARGARPVRGEALTAWPDWTSALWEQARTAYGFTAARERADLERWYPDPTRERRVAFYDGPTPVGWAVLLDTQMRASAHFGNLRVATLVDCLSRPGDELAVARAALRAAAARGAELCVANFTSAPWREALRTLGFLGGPSNYVLATSRALTAAAPELASDPGRVHVGRGDGDGRIHL